MAYDAYGTPSLTQGSLGNLYLFTGRRYDPEAGLYYYRARYLEPETGRFAHRDPLGGLPSYAYVGNNPTNLVDPLGWQAAVVDVTDYKKLFGTGGSAKQAPTPYGGICGGVPPECRALCEKLVNTLLTYEQVMGKTVPSSLWQEIKDLLRKCEQASKAKLCSYSEALPLPLGTSPPGPSVPPYTGPPPPPPKSVWWNLFGFLQGPAEAVQWLSEPVQSGEEVGLKIVGFAIVYWVSPYYLAFGEIGLAVKPLGPRPSTLRPPVIPPSAVEKTIMEALKRGKELLKLLKKPHKTLEDMKRIIELLNGPHWP